MDYIVGKTFLTICELGTFGAAANALNVTQTTITARIKSLESELNCTLFTRNKSGAVLTKNGEHFKSYARQVVQTWDAAKRDLPLPDNAKNSLAIGVDLTLWNPIAAALLAMLNKEAAELAITIEVGDKKQLNEKVRSGGLDVALVHQPEYSSRTIVEHLLDEKLVRVQSVEQPEPYLYVDWGDEFKRLHDQALPELARSKISISLGPVALQLMLKSGGSGYFRTRVINRHLHEGTLKLTPDAPEFSYPVYLLQYANKDININELKKIFIQVLADEDEWF
ncbi:LysR family transcriptional regulator [Colwellia sp. 1_MG-2023]|uniref:LysR family transcriptional regulator n=1 Tax=Colwellia sp. 1_MG-2023 TaxID=3062649 RepID=UPI0026E4774C|nr:LysR family transcriptional regulator [Colwellia sp. 1_MG-2023]MDO6446380.1 LysR family transcriptional regulator [Colwellia sp. 1_MG-2023]